MITLEYMIDCEFVSRVQSFLYGREVFVLKSFVLELLPHAPKVCGGDEAMSNSTVLRSNLYQHSDLVTYSIRHCCKLFGAINSPLEAETDSLNLPVSILSYRQYSFGGWGLMTQHHVDLCALCRRGGVGMWRYCGQGQYGNAWLFGSAHKLCSLNLCVCVARQIAY